MVLSSSVGHLSQVEYWLADALSERTPQITELASLTTWHFQHEIPIPQDLANLMVPGEQPVAAYATFRDSAIFTTKRLIVRDAQGLRGKKV